MSDEIAIECSEVTRTFGATTALDGVTFRVAAGEVHALVGENGAGKSTLLGILSGRIGPTSGSVKVFGKPLPFGNPRASLGSGISAVHQELKIVPALSAQANVFLGMEESNGIFLSEKEMRRRFMELLEPIGRAIPPDAKAGSLSVSQQQLIEIMRGLNAEARVLLLDEPTAALPESEREAVMDLIRLLKSKGISVVLVSHNLDEVLEVSDTVTVLRNGSTVRSAPRSEWNKRELVKAMLGRYMDYQARQERLLGEEILRVKGLEVEGRLEEIEFTLRRGEILGLAGLVGSGRSTLLRSLAGAEKDARGRIMLDGRWRDLPSSPRQGLAMGIGLLPEDRKNQGLMLAMTARDNLTMMDLATVSRYGMVSVDRQREILSRLSKAVGFDPKAGEKNAGQLSGGNQQKILLAKLLHANPRVLLADEPTRGVDIGSKADILTSLESLAAEGLAIIVASSELEDVLTISDRVLVLSEGKKVREMSAGEERLSVAEVLEAAFRVEEVVEP